MVVRHGRVVAEGWWAPYSAGTLIHRVQEAEDRGRIYPLIRWRTARQETRHDASLGHDRTRNRVHPAGVGAPGRRARRSRLEVDPAGTTDGDGLTCRPSRISRPAAAMQLGEP